MKKSLIPRKLSLHRNGSGMALVVCLALIVLITAAVLAFFARATSNRVVEVSRVNRIKTEQLAQSAGDYVIGNFVKEIAASTNNAAITTVGDFTIYQPLNGNKAVPERKIATALSGDTNFINLIRQSIPSADTNASGHSSAAASRNGRYIDASRWNAPALLIGNGFTATNTLPNWIYLTANATPTNAPSTETIGRFSYNVYSEAGLLDINVAGYSSATVPSSVDVAALKNSLAGADLSKLGITQSTINDLVSFRNPQATTATQYKQQTSAALKDGFINRTGSGYAHNLLASRQDLIRYAKNSPDPELFKALPYLTTFTRMVNAPSFTPDPNRPAKDDAVNPSLINTRVTTPFTRTDGTLAITGEPLIKHRFPLSRLAWITKDGPLTGVTAQQIEDSFGLTYSPTTGGTWTYTKTGSGNRILNLAEVADAGREPNFFELLQAGTMRGSLGMQIVSTDENAETQIFQIGANIIDQYDGNSFPTRIIFAGTSVSGIEDIPYISRIVPQIYTSAANKQHHQGWYRVEVWNPHAPSTSAEIPTEFRYMVGPGTVSINIYDLSNNLVSAGIARDILNDFPDNKNGIIIPNSNPTLFRVPYRVSNSSTTTFVISTGMNAYHLTDHPYNGFYIGDIIADVQVNREAEIAANSVSHRLEYKSPTSGDWIPYHTVRNIPQVKVRTNNVPDRPWNNFSMSHVAASDPRSDRFGLYKFYFPTSTALPATSQTIRPTEASGLSSTQPNWFGATIYPGLLTENNAARSGDKTHYADPDGLVRRADGGYATGALSNGGYPMSNPASMPVTAASAPDRPIVLNRPFISVAELGYASRGMPWKSLDFFTSESADAALSDLFSISEGPTSAAIAGCIDPNSPHEKVLESVFSGASKAEGISDLPTGNMTPSLLAQSLRQTTSTTPLLNRSELVTKWIGDIGKIPANSQDTIIKQRREAPVRALAEVSNTRTWNLLIDLVAQTGKFTAPDNFVVQGEARYWMHVALDRYTGRIVDQYIEPVLE